MARKEDIRALCAYLSGTWAGISTDAHGRVTHLKPLHVTASHEHDNMHIKLEGTGESVWKDMAVQYSLRGALDVTSLQFELVEELHGISRNPVRYAGSLCLTSKSTELAVTGNNSGASSERYLVPTDVRQILDAVASGASVLCLRGDLDRGKIILWQSGGSTDARCGL